MTSDDEPTEIIFVPSIRLRNGRRIYAHHYGKRAFPNKVRRKPKRKEARK